MQADRHKEKAPAFTLAGGALGAVGTTGNVAQGSATDNRERFTDLAYAMNRAAALYADRVRLPASGPAAPRPAAAAGALPTPGATDAAGGPLGNKGDHVTLELENASEKVSARVNAYRAHWAVRDYLKTRGKVEVLPSLFHCHSRLQVRAARIEGEHGSRLAYSTGGFAGVLHGASAVPGEWRQEFSNVYRCKSPACPICSDRLGRIRAAEITAAVESWLQGGPERDVCMFSLTCSHRKTSKLSELYEMSGSARREFWRSRKVIRLLRASGALMVKGRSIARITSEETTWSEYAGYHPHAHILVFLDKTKAVVPWGDVVLQLQSEWCRIARAEGLTVDEVRGLNVQQVQEHGDYISKFGVELAWREVKGAKVGEVRHYSMMGLLAAYQETGEETYLETWLHWAEVSKGRRWIVWSDGLKGFFKLAEVSDDEAIEADERTMELGFAVYPSTWVKLYYSRSLPALRRAGLSGGPVGTLRFLQAQGFVPGRDFTIEECVREMVNGKGVQHEQRS